MDKDRMRSSDPMVVAVLTAASAPAEAPLPGEAAALAAFRRAHLPSRRARFVHSLVRAKVGALAVAGGVVLASGVATAATGNLPVVASLTGHNHSSSHGTGPDSHAGNHPATKGQSGVHETTAGAPDGIPDPRHDARPGGETASGTHGNGAAVSSTATTTTATGVDKGQTICSTASGDKCRAGDNPSQPQPAATGTPHGSPTTGVTHRSTTAQPHVARTRP